MVICDRGVMDASAFISRAKWEQLLAKLGLTEEHVCEGRYNQVIHMVKKCVKNWENTDEYALTITGCLSFSKWDYEMWSH